MMTHQAWSPPSPPELKELLQSQGLTLMGVCAATPDPTQSVRYQEWIDKGFNGDMAWLQTHAGLKYNPQAILPECKSLIFVGLNYRQEIPPSLSGHGSFATYAWGRDYHKVLGKKMKALAVGLQEIYPQDAFRAFTDTSPLDERFYAELAGISFTGRNHLAISSHFGSWFLLGQVLSTREFPASPPAEGRHGACPSGCRRCLVACPTGALSLDGRMDASRCIAYLTIEHEGPIPLELRPLMGNKIFGCDDCQNCCPHNLRAPLTSEVDFLTWKAGPQRDLAQILALRSTDEFLAIFAGSAVVRAGWRQLVRNACVAAGNSGQSRLIPALQELADCGDELIAEHARWALQMLRPDTVAATGLTI